MIASVRKRPEEFVWLSCFWLRRFSKANAFGVYVLMKSMPCFKAAINGIGPEIKINSLKDHGNIKLKGQTYGSLF